MKRGPGPLAVAGLVLLLAGASFLTIELIQRHRFNRMRDALTRPDHAPAPHGMG